MACVPQAASPGLVSEVVLRLTGLFLLTPLPFPPLPTPTLAAAGGERAALNLQPYSTSTRVGDSHVLQTDTRLVGSGPVLFK